MGALRRLLTAAAFAAAVTGQSPPAYFELTLPDFNRSIPGGTDVLVDLPVQQISQLTIQILGSADTNLTYGDVRVRINGKGARNVFDSGSNARGKYLAMSPSTLRMRRDKLFDREENAIEVYGKDKRGREYYQNWVLRSRSDANRYFTYVSSMSPLDTKGLPPDIVIESPLTPVLFPTGKASVLLHIKGTASAASGIAALTVDSKDYNPPETKGTALPIDLTVPVTRGSKSVTAEVADAKGNKRSVSFPIVYPEAAATPPKLSGQTWAVIIGSSRYTAKEGAPPPLPYASIDAEALKGVLKSKGVHDENILLLTGEQATIEQVRTALRDFTAKAESTDLLIVYWATHGIHDPASPDQIYLAASDTQMLHLSETAMELSELQLMLDRSVRSRHTLLFFDAEHALGDAWSFQGKPIINVHLLNLFDDQLGRSVVVAGASPGTGESRSSFVSAIDDGLNGKADVDQNRVVSARELCDYVLENLKKEPGGSLAQASLSKREEDTPVMALR